MKTKKLLFILSLFLSAGVFAQVNINENFNSSTSLPSGWVSGGDASMFSTSTAACDGNSLRTNLYGSNPTNTTTTSSQTSNGEDITFVFDYKLMTYSYGTPTSAEPLGFGNIKLQYSVDNGSYTTFYTIDDSNHSVSTSCATVSQTIVGSNITSSSSVKFRWSTTRSSGDWYFYLDNVSISQPVFTPPNCTTLSSPANASTTASVSTNLTWTSATGIPTGYKISLGTTSGGTDILNSYDAGLVTSYNLPNDLAYNSNYYATVVPYNANGDATGCSETSFTTSDGCKTPSSPSNGTTTAPIAPNISWSSVTGATGYLVSIGTTEGGTDILNAYDNGTSSSYSASGLSYSTEYFVTVKAKNLLGTTSAACTGYSFTTRADPTLTPPFINDFSSYPGLDWTEAKGELTTSTSFSSTSSNWSSDGFGNVGSSGAARMEIYSTGREEWLISPPINLGDGSTAYRLEFDLALTYWSSSSSDVLGPDDEFSVVISTDNGATWTSANILQEWGSGDAISNTGEHVIIDLSSYTGIIKLGFYAESTVTGGDVNVYVDNVEVKAIPSCESLYNIAVSSITDTGLSATWDAITGATNYDWEVVPFGDSPGSNTVASGTVSTNTASITGLTATTDYDFFVRNNCGSGEVSAWSSAVSFTTNCTPVATFSENFDATTTETVPSCWTELIDGGASSYAYADVRATNANSGSNSLSMYNSYSYGSGNIIIVSPILSNVNAGTHRLKFFAKNNSSSQDIEVGTISDPTDGSTFTSLAAVDINTTYSQYVVDFSSYSGSDQYIAIRRVLTSSNANFVNLDDMVWESIPTTPPSCVVLTTPSNNATAVDVDDTLYWSSDIDATGYKIKIGTTSGASDYLAETDVQNVTSYNPTDFAYNTQYFVTVIAYNANGDATSCTETSFTTDEGCLTPSSPSNGSTSASITTSISWSSFSVAGETGFIISIGTTAGGTDIVNAHDNGTSTSYSASGLSYETEYFVTVKAKNAQGTTSAACTGYSFTTKAAPQSLPYSQDFEGDTSEIVITGTNTNKFFIGTAANNGGAKSLYVSNDSGTSNEYSTSSTSTAWASIDVDLTSHSAATLSFDWRCDGEGGNGSTVYDYGEVWINIGANDVRISDSKEFVASTSYQNEIIDLSSYVGNVATIKFKWYNDGSSGDNPPLSVDNISIVDPTIVWSSNAWSNTNGPTANDNALVNDDLTLTGNLNCADLTIASGKTLTVASGTVLNVTGDLTNNGSIVFESDASGTGTFATYTGAAIAGTGNVKAEQYVGAKRAWRMLTSPLKGATNNMVYDNWQNAGTQATGTGMNLFSATGGNGLHAGGLAHSIKKYPTDGAATAWIDVTNTQTEPLFTATKNNAFVVFTTGPYTSAAANITSGSAETVYSANGSLITGDVAYTSLPTDAYSFIGNPYASPINPASIFTDNTAFTKLWVWDPSLSNVGGYLAYDVNVGWSNISASYSNTSGAETMIQSGQAFFVKPATASTLTIKETHKSSMVDNGTFFRTSTSTVEQVRVELSKTVNGVVQNEDAAVVALYADGANEVNALDTEKMTKGGENISILADQSYLTIEHRATAQTQDEVQLYLYGMNDADVYTLKVYTKDYAGLQPYLWDIVNDTYHIIPTDGSFYEHSFTMLDPNNEKQRFRVVFDASLSNTILDLDQITLYPNPVKDGNFTIGLPTQLENVSFSIVNILGQTVKNGTLQSGNNQIELNVAAGVYNVIMNTTNNSTTKRILIK